MGPEEDDVPEGFRPPLPPEDRVWRHPAELAAADRSARRTDRVRRRRRGALFFTASALSGAGAVLLALAAIGELSDGDRTDVAVADSVPEATFSPSAPPTTATFDDLETAETSMRAVVRIRARGDDGTTYGSGVFLPHDGSVLTTADLVDDADEVSVWIDGGVQLPAVVLGTDATSDVAVVQVVGRNLPRAVLGSADDLVPGDVALVLDASRSPGEGVLLAVSSVVATRRNVQVGDRVLHGMLQLEVLEDVERPGIVLARDGRIVGLATAQADQPGYVTTIDWAMRVADDLMDDGTVDHAWLGVDGTDVHADDADAYGAIEGARVVAVRAESPAAAAGLVADDVIVAVDDDPVRSMGDLVLAVRPHHPGDTIRVRYLRDGRERSCEADLGRAGPHTGTGDPLEPALASIG